MNRDESLRLCRKGSLRLAKIWVDESDGRVGCDGHTAEDLLRIVRNDIWGKYGPEELETLEAEIDLGL